MINTKELMWLKFGVIKGLYYDYYIRNSKGVVVAIKQAYVSISHDYDIKYQTAEITFIDTKTTAYLMVNLENAITDLFYADNITKVLDLKGNVIYESK